MMPSSILRFSVAALAAATLVSCGDDRIGESQSAGSVSTASQAVPPFSAFLYAVGAAGTPQAGQLLWYKHGGANDGSVAWDGQQVVVGTGWGGFARVFAGDQGAIYGIAANGDLYWYGHAGQADGTTAWARGSGTVVGSGWGGFAQVFAGPKGVLYGVQPNGDLLWYRHDGFDGSGRGFAEGSGSVIRAGFAQPGDLVFAGSAKSIYRYQAADGKLLWYRHDGQLTGGTNFGGNGAGTHILTITSGVRWITAGPGGVLYLASAGGDLLWLHHRGVYDGTASFTGGAAGKTIGNGWTQSFASTVFAVAFPGVPAPTADNPSSCICPPGKQYWGGLCYNACPSGTRRTASCSCLRTTAGTNCDAYGIKAWPVYECLAGTENYGGRCYKACPSGKRHTAVCTCAKLSSFFGVPIDTEIETNCDAYGPASSPTPTASCESHHELYGGLCYGRCPDGTRRTAACTCEDPNETDCSKWGNPTLPTNCSTKGVCSQLFEDAKRSLPAPKTAGEGFGEGMATCLISAVEGGFCLLPDLVQGLAVPTGSRTCDPLPPVVSTLCSFFVEGVLGIENVLTCVENANLSVQGADFGVHVTDALCRSMGEMAMTIGVSKALKVNLAGRSRYIDRFFTLLGNSWVQGAMTTQMLFLQTFKTCVNAL